MKLVSLLVFVLVFGCQKKSGGGSGSGDSGSPAAAIDPGPTAGAIIVNPTPESTPSSDPTPESSPSSELKLTATPMSQTIAVRPALAVGTLAISLLEQSELDLFSEEKFVWNPAQVPLDELNKIVCVLAKSGFHIYGNKGKYIAKIDLKECFKSSIRMNSGNSSNSRSLPVDVIVETTTREDKSIALRMWFTRKLNNDIANESELSAVPVFELWNTIDLNYFVEASIGEVPSTKNPFGLFDMRWEMKIVRDGTADSKTYQQGYVTTTRDNEKGLLRYNQRNWRYMEQTCGDRAWVKHAGVLFTANNPGPSINNTALAFNGTDSIQTVLTNAGVQSDVGIANIEDYVPASSTLTLSGGDANTKATATSGALTLEADIATADVNNTQVQFDGVKKLSEVLEAYFDQHHHRLTPTLALTAVLPAGNVTLNGGVSTAPATASITIGMDTIVIIGQKSPDGGAKLNGYKIKFAAGKSINDTLADLGNPIQGYSLSVQSGDGSLSPSADTVVTLSGGVSPQEDIWAFIEEYKASAQMEHIDGKPVRGEAHTASGFSSSNTTNLCAAFMPSREEAPLTYGLVFDRYDKYPNGQEPSDPSQKITYPGRAVLKQFNDYTPRSNVANGFDPATPRCEQMGGEFPNTWDYELFTDDGKHIDYQTSFPVYIEDSPNTWGDGWASEWGISIWGEIPAGKRAYIKLANGDKKWFDIVPYNGILRDSVFANVNEKQSTGSVVLKCDQYCPAGEVTTTQLQNMYDPTYFLYNEEYVFNYEDKKLYRDTDKDGDGDVVIKLADDAEGMFNLNLTLKSNPTEKFVYDMASWQSEVALRSNNTNFRVPRSIKFDLTQTYNADIAYPGTETTNASHNGQSFANLVDSSGELKFEYGSLCCLEFESKAGTFDQWGNTAFGPKIALKKGTQLTVDPNAADPDDTGPITPGMKVRIAPAFTELQPVSKTDCSSTLNAKLTSIQTNHPLPGPLTNALDRQISTKIGARPTGTHPVLIIDGKAAQ